MKSGGKDINKRLIGSSYEEKARRHLEASGYEIREMNFRCRNGEIDIIANHEGYLVFVEVKYRTDCRKGNPEEAINRSKQKTICKVADYYLYSHRLGTEKPCRFDAVVMQGQEIRIIKNAFDYIR